MINREMLPWLLLVILILLVMALLGIYGYENWSDFKEAT